MVVSNVECGAFASDTLAMPPPFVSYQQGEAYENH